MLMYNKNIYIFSKIKTLLCECIICCSPLSTVFTCLLGSFPPSVFSGLFCSLLCFTSVLLFLLLHHLFPGLLGRRWAAAVSCSSPWLRRRPEKPSSLWTVRRWWLVRCLWRTFFMPWRSDNRVHSWQKPVAMCSFDSLCWLFDQLLSFTTQYCT